MCMKITLKTESFSIYDKKTTYKIEFSNTFLRGQLKNWGTYTHNIADVSEKFSIIKNRTD